MRKSIASGAVRVWSGTITSTRFPARSRFARPSATTSPISRSVSAVFEIF